MSLMCELLTITDLTLLGIISQLVCIYASTKNTLGGVQDQLQTAWDIEMTAER